MKLSFHARVQREVDDAVAWYEEQQEGLGDDFFSNFSYALQQISVHPEAFAF